MKLLCITDPGTHPPFDTTVELYNRLARDPRIELFHAPVESFLTGSAFRSCRIEAPLSFEEFLELNARCSEGLRPAGFDLAFSRADKPFPPDFYEGLQRCEPYLSFVNRPSGLEQSSQRLFLRQFAELMPDHIFTRRVDEAVAFLREHQQVVAKLNISYGGKGVYRMVLQSDGSVQTDNVVDGAQCFPSAEAAFGGLLAKQPDELQIVRYLRNNSEGDKRVLAVDGEIYGGFVRFSAHGHWVHNITAGGDFKLATISEAERRVVAETSPVYAALGVYTLGYDFLMNDDGSWILSEINAGNIGGYGRLERLTAEPIFQRLIDWLVRKDFTPGGRF